MQKKKSWDDPEIVIQQGPKNYINKIIIDLLFIYSKGAFSGKEEWFFWAILLGKWRPEAILS